MNSIQQSNNTAKAFISPVGGILAIICFFLPWVKFSLMMQQTFIGFGLVRNDAYLLLVLLAAATIISVFFYMRSKNRVWKSKPYILISSGVALLVLLYEFIQFHTGVKTPFGNYTPKDVGLSLQFGFYGAVLAFIIAAVGGLLLTEEQIASVAETSMVNCPNCGAPVKTGAKFCKECGVQLSSSESEEQTQADAEASRVTVCSKCGTQIKAGAKFCKECGAKLGE